MLFRQWALLPSLAFHLILIFMALKGIAEKYLQIFLDAQYRHPPWFWNIVGRWSYLHKSDSHVDDWMHLRQFLSNQHPAFVRKWKHCSYHGSTSLDHRRCRWLILDPVFDSLFQSSFWISHVHSNRLHATRFPIVASVVCEVARPFLLYFHYIRCKEVDFDFNAEAFFTAYPLLSILLQISNISNVAVWPSYPPSKWQMSSVTSSKQCRPLLNRETDFWFEYEYGPMVPSQEGICGHWRVQRNNNTTCKRAIHQDWPPLITILWTLPRDQV